MTLKASSSNEYGTTVSHLPLRTMIVSVPMWWPQHFIGNEGVLMYETNGQDWPEPLLQTVNLYLIHAFGRSCCCNGSFHTHHTVKIHWKVCVRHVAAVQLVQISLELLLQQSKTLIERPQEAMNYTRRVAATGFDANSVGADAANDQIFDCQMSTHQIHVFCRVSLSAIWCIPNLECSRS